MQFDVEINNQPVSAKRGETIKNVLDRIGIHVPTLCYLSGFSPTGGCRMCVVEVDGFSELVPSCSHPVTEWMKIKTHSPRVLKARKVLVELLLAGHPDDCLYCERSGKCGLQDLAAELNVRERKYHGKRQNIQIDKACLSIVRDPAKCVLCGRCIRICDEIIGVSAIDIVGRGSESKIGTTYNKGLNTHTCVKCGQCIMVCPTGALTEKSNIQAVLDALNNPVLFPVIQFSPTVPASIGEDFNIKASKDILNLLRAALKKMGFRQVFDTSMTADLTIMEEAAEFIERFQKHENLPFLTSCCPSWVKYIESTRPQLLSNLSTTASPQQMMGRLIKNYIASSAGQKVENVFVVSVMPCTAKKHEADQDRMNDGITRNVDVVITTRELVSLIRLLGIDFNSLEPEPVDTHYSMRSAAGNLFGISGGHLEGLLRTVYQMMTGQEMSTLKINELRGLKGRKEAKIKIGKATLFVAAVSGLANVKSLVEDIEARRDNFSIIEVMACPNGCINGGGQKLNPDEKSIKSRMKALYDVDEEEMIRVAHKNPVIIDLYEKFLAKPGSDRNKELLHVVRTTREGSCVIHFTGNLCLP
ncbi:MAG: [FeFe] hydrogenase, group A [Bacteroidetes bacterium]|nr:[FeFe] hydrogenase, group A [Bacteroidota bacterium]